MEKDGHFTAKDPDFCLESRGLIRYREPENLIPPSTYANGKVAHYI